MEAAAAVSAGKCRGNPFSFLFRERIKCDERSREQSGVRRADQRRGGDNAACAFGHKETVTLAVTGRNAATLSV